MKRACLNCGAPTRGSKCGGCLPEGHTPARRYRDSTQWKKIRAALLAQHRATHGDLCPGTSTHPPHPTNDLTIDHIDPLHLTGTDTGRYRVLCRQENGRLGQQER